MDKCCEYMNYNKCCLGADTDMMCDGYKYECENHSPKNSSKNKKLIENENGALRESKEGKGRFDLIPYKALLHVAKHYQDGAKIHGERNWEKGIDLIQCFSSAISHTLIANDMFSKNNFIKGKILDRNNESYEYHLRAAVWNLFVILNGLEV